MGGQEGYGPAWVKVTLMVHKTQGVMHCVGGDQEEGEGDRPYIGYDLLKNRIAKCEEDRDRIVEKYWEARERILELEKDAWKTVAWLEGTGDIACGEVAKSIRTVLERVGGMGPLPKSVPGLKKGAVIAGYEVIVVIGEDQAVVKDLAAEDRALMIVPARLLWCTRDALYAHVGTQQDMAAVAKLLQAVVDAAFNDKSLRTPQEKIDRIYKVIMADAVAGVKKPEEGESESCTGRLYNPHGSVQGQPFVRCDKCRRVDWKASAGDLCQKPEEGDVPPKPTPPPNRLVKEGEVPRKPGRGVDGKPGGS